MDCLLTGVVSKCSDSEQCCWHLLHSDRRPWHLNDHLASRVHVQVEKTNRPTKGKTCMKMRKC